MNLCLDFKDVPPNTEFVVMKCRHEPHQFVVLDDEDTVGDVRDKFSHTVVVGKAKKLENDE